MLFWCPVSLFWSSCTCMVMVEVAPRHPYPMMKAKEVSFMLAEPQKHVSDVAVTAQDLESVEPVTERHGCRKSYSCQHPGDLCPDHCRCWCSNWTFSLSLTPSVPRPPNQLLFWLRLPSLLALIATTALMDSPVFEHERAGGSPWSHTSQERNRIRMHST